MESVGNYLIIAYTLYISELMKKVILKASMLFSSHKYQVQYCCLWGRKKTLFLMICLSEGKLKRRRDTKDWSSRWHSKCLQYSGVGQAGSKSLPPNLCVRGRASDPPLCTQSLPCRFLGRRVADKKEGHRALLGNWQKFITMVTVLKHLVKRHFKLNLTLSHVCKQGVQGKLTRCLGQSTIEMGIVRRYCLPLVAE